MALAVHVPSKHTSPDVIRHTALRSSDFPPPRFASEPRQHYARSSLPASSLPRELNHRSCFRFRRMALANNLPPRPCFAHQLLVGLALKVIDSRSIL